MAECYNKIYLKKQKIHVNCGKCLNCISNKKKEYGLRMMQEQMSDKSLVSYFGTLTYNDAFCPLTNEGKLTLYKQHINAYIRRLQAETKRMQGKLIYFVGGEYGERTARPHYHIIVLSNRPLFNQMREYWTYGNAQIELSWSFKATSYTVGYANKKIGLHEFNGVEKPFHKFTRGIGETWIHEAIAKKKVSEKKYYIENQVITSKLPDYYKKKLRNFIMCLIKKMIIVGYKHKSHKTKLLTPELYRYLKNANRKEILKEFGYTEKEKYIYKIDMIGNKTKHIIIWEYMPEYKYKYYENDKEVTNIDKIIEAEEKWKNFKIKVNENLKDKTYIKEYYYLKTKYKAWNNDDKIDYYKYYIHQKENDEDFDMYKELEKIAMFDADIKKYTELHRRKLKDEAYKKYYMKEKKRIAI